MPIKDTPLGIVGRLFAPSHRLDQRQQSIHCDCRNSWNQVVQLLMPKAKKPVVGLLRGTIRYSGLVDGSWRSPNPKYGWEVLPQVLGAACLVPGIF